MLSYWARLSDLVCFSGLPKHKRHQLSVNFSSNFPFCYVFLATKHSITFQISWIEDLQRTWIRKKMRYWGNKLKPKDCTLDEDFGVSWVSFISSLIDSLSFLLKKKKGCSHSRNSYQVFFLLFLSFMRINSQKGLYGNSPKKFSILKKKKKNSVNFCSNSLIFYFFMEFLSYC